MGTRLMVPGRELTWHINGEICTKCRKKVAQIAATNSENFMANKLAIGALFTILQGLQYATNVCMNLYMFNN